MKKRMKAGREYLERVAFEWSELEWGKHHSRLVESIKMILHENAQLRLEKLCILDALRAEYIKRNKQLGIAALDADVSMADFAELLGYLNALKDIIDFIKNI